MLRRLASSAALVAAAVLLAGCTPPEPVETTTPATASETTDHQVLDGTRDAWEAYQARLSELGANPGAATVEPILEVASPEFADFLLENLRAAADRRIHTEGTRRTTHFSISDSSDGPERVTADACVDLSQERIVGDEGVEISRPETPQSQSIAFVRADDQAHYLVDGVTDFDGSAEDDPCA